MVTSNTGSIGSAALALLAGGPLPPRPRPLPLPPPPPRLPRPPRPAAAVAYGSGSSNGSGAGGAARSSTRLPSTRVWRTNKPAAAFGQDFKLKTCTTLSDGPLSSSDPHPPRMGTSQRAGWRAGGHRHARRQGSPTRHAQAVSKHQFAPLLPGGGVPHHHAGLAPRDAARGIPHQKVLPGLACSALIQAKSISMGAGQGSRGWGGRTGACKRVGGQAGNAAV